MNQIRFDGRVAIVTGAGGGLGRTYALELARRGAAVVVNDPGVARDGTGGSAAPAEVVAQEIVAAGGLAIADHHSVATVAGGGALVQAALERFGRVDIVIHNAGILRDRSFLKMTEDEWDAVLAVHLKGVYTVCRPAMVAMRAQQYGRIVLTTSGAGLFGNFGQANYAAAKMGQIGAMQVLNLEALQYGIRVNAISPAAATRMTADVAQASGTPPECVTPAVVYLASEACQQSGLIIRAQGGFFSRQGICFNSGVAFGPEPVAAEDVAAHWEEITDLGSMRCFEPGMRVAEQIRRSARAVPAPRR